MGGIQMNDENAKEIGVGHCLDGPSPGALANPPKLSTVASPPSTPGPELTAAISQMLIELSGTPWPSRPGKTTLLKLCESRHEQPSRLGCPDSSSTFPLGILCISFLF